MKTAKHTAGQWKEGTGWIYAEDNGRTHVCTIPNYPYGDSEANAKLIAAAPDLLEVVELLIKIQDKHDSPINGILSTKARAAIAKAKGE